MQERVRAKGFQFDMVFRAFHAATAAALILSAMPAAAQQFSDGYQFLDAIRDADGAKVNKYLDDKTMRIVNTKDRGTGEGALHDGDLIAVRLRDHDVIIGSIPDPSVSYSRSGAERCAAYRERISRALGPSD